MRTVVHYQCRDIRSFPCEEVIGLINLEVADCRELELRTERSVEDE